jgi:metallo-beta-lactamase class B
MPSTHAISALLAFAAFGAAVGAQQPQPAAGPDSPEVLQLVESASRSAGTEWTETVTFICSPNASRPNRPDDPEIEPTRVFDNLYVVGRTGTAVWIVTTSAGIVLIDSGYADQLETVLLPGMRRLGLDPAQVSYVLLGHGHADHFGGARYFQQRGARVVMAGPDWNLVENPPARRGGAAPRAGGAAPAARGPAPSPAQPPTRDIEAAEQQPIAVGDVTFTPVMVPGHTPGSMGVIFPVKDGPSTHTAGLYGGSILTPGILSDQQMQQYIESVGHWAEVTGRMNVDVEIQNHPMYDGFLTKLERLKQRTPGAPHPFVVGRDGYQRFVRIMSDCTKAQLARRRIR